MGASHDQIDLRSDGAGRQVSRRRLLLAAAVAAIVVAAIGLVTVQIRGTPDAGGMLEGSWPAGATRSTTASAFTVGWVPEGYEPTAAHTGLGDPYWGSDSFGTSEPTTLLAPAGEAPRRDNAVVVSVTGFAGYQGGLAQASEGYSDDMEELRIDQRDAVYAHPGGRRSGGRRTGAGDLVVAVEEDLAVRVNGAGMELPELLALLSRVHPRGRTMPPEVDPPEGMRVVGGVDAVFGTQGEPAHLGGPEKADAFSVTWESDGTALVVTTLRGISADPPAIVARSFDRGVTRSSTVALDDGRTAVLHEVSSSCEPDCPAGSTTMLAATTPWGDLLLVESATADSATLARVAASVRPTSRESWESYLIAAAGGRELAPDEGHVEVARGTQGGVEWLLQASPDGLTAETWEAPCLKLSNLADACAHGGSYSGNADRSHWSSPPEPGATVGAPDLPAFTVVQTTTASSTVRITAEGQTVEAPMHRLPGSPPQWAGIGFVDPALHTHIADCGDPPPIEELDFMRIELLDGEGRVVRCFGIDDG